MDYLNSIFSRLPNPQHADTTPSTSKPKPQQPRRLNRNQLYAKPAPLDIYPLPPLTPSNPLSYLPYLWAVIYPYLVWRTSHTTIHHGYYSPLTRSVHVTDEKAIRALWEQGFFGKGSLSRSEPEWLERERKRVGSGQRNTANEVTTKRREERRLVKRERARVEREELEAQLRKEGKLLVTSNTNGSVHPPSTTTDPTASRVTTTDSAEPAQDGDANEPETATQTSPLERTEQAPILRNQEHLQLTPHESLYLSYTLGVLSIHPPPSPSPSTTTHPLNTPTLLHLFRRTSTFLPLGSGGSAGSNEKLPPDDPFILSYITYQHFRSLGWVVRPGIKFAVDWLLYARGPVFSHAEFGVQVTPSYSRWPGERSEPNHPTSSDDSSDSKKGGKGESQMSSKERAEGEKGEWWHLHAISRVQTQVVKSLVLVYVDVPPPSVATPIQHDLGALLKQYKVREFVVRRWTPNRSRG